ncbi:hypothetical protein BJX76DRAFT_320068 [Aspergillus varians]
MSSQSRAVGHLRVPPHPPDYRVLGKRPDASPDRHYQRNQGIESRIDDLGSSLGENTSPRCRLKKKKKKNKRGLIDGMLDAIGGAFDAFINKLNCITENFGKLKVEIEGKNINKDKNIVDKLISSSDDPSDDESEDDDPTGGLSSASTTSSTLSCSSDSTAYEVTASCEPTSITSASSTTKSTTCLPMTTITTTRCSVTDTTTAVTNTPTPTQADLSGKGSYGGGCPSADGGWVTLGAVDCGKIPTNTVSAAPTASDASALRREYNLDEHKNELPTDSLALLPAYGAQLTKFLTDIARQLTKTRRWLAHKKGETTGKWYGFVNERTAAGVTGLFGCTSVMIVSNKGVYASHIYENPVFLNQHKEGKTVPSAEDYFRKATFDALVNGNSASGMLEPIKDLVGTAEKPGPLHHVFKPKIFLITPFKHGASGPFTYATRVKWLSDQLFGYLYPDGLGEKPSTLGYKVPAQYIAESASSPPGKAILEATQIDRYDKVGQELRPVGRWRLWVNGKETVTWECSISTSSKHPSSSLSPTTHSSTTKTTTKSTTSSTTTATASGPEPLPSDPSLVEDTKCYEHANASATKIDKDIIRKLADKCEKISDNAYSAEWDLGKDDGEPYYFAQVYVDSQCDAPAQNPQYPMKGYSCRTLIKENFEELRVG